MKLKRDSGGVWMTSEHETAAMFVAKHLVEMFPEKQVDPFFRTNFTSEIGLHLYRLLDAAAGIEVIDVVPKD